MRRRRNRRGKWRWNRTCTLVRVEFQVLILAGLRSDGPILGLVPIRHIVVDRCKLNYLAAGLRLQYASRSGSGFTKQTSITEPWASYVYSSWAPVSDIVCLAQILKLTRVSPGITGLVIAQGLKKVSSPSRLVGLAQALTSGSGWYPI